MKKQLFLILLILSISEFAMGLIRCVTPNGAGAKNGTNWKNAYDSTQLQTAINEAGVKVVWVAAGTYRPTTGTDRGISFTMKNGVSVYGGFIGTESSTSQRNWKVNITVLSGDIGITGDGNDNSYHVVSNSGIDSTAVLDGFTIKDGFANDGNSGGGVFNVSSSPIITNCTITGNDTESGGGGIFNSFSSPILTDCLITDNFAGNGGGIKNISSSPKIIDCKINGNFSKGAGGGIYNDLSSPIFVNCTISGNGNGEEWGGGMFNGNSSSSVLVNSIISYNSSEVAGGVENANSMLILTNCLITNNGGRSHGGGISNHSSTLILTNCTMSQNDAGYYGGGIYSEGSTSIINNSILWGNNVRNKGGGSQIYFKPGKNSTVSFNYSCYSNKPGDIQIDGNGTISPDVNCITTNPIFINPNKDFRIVRNSPCADAGNDALNTQPTDIRGPGFGRKLLKTDSYTAGIIDMGAYEYNSKCDPEYPQLLRSYVKWDASGADNGTSWADAYTSLQSAIANAEKGYEIWVAAGTYKPTTGNGRFVSFQIPHEVAVYGGFTGMETLLGQRDWTTNKTILSGDLNGDDIITGSGATLSITGNSENTRQVVILDEFSVLDGFTIQAGNADGGMAGGGGVCMRNSASTLNNCIIKWNYGEKGGGMCSYGSSNALNNCTISENCAQFGGGVSNLNSSILFTNCQIENNSASISGGGVHNEYSSSPIFANCLIVNNSALVSGGGLYNANSDTPSLINCTLSGNSASKDGGGIFSMNSSSPTISNSIIYNNTAIGKGSQIYLSDGTTTLNYSCYSNGPNDVFSNGIFTPDANCIYADPSFVNPVSDFRITANSPCIDAGYSDYNTEEYDLRIQPRIQNSNIDMGAYEWTVGFDPMPTGLPDELSDAIKVFVVNGVITVVSGLSITGKAKVTDMAGRTLAMENLVAGSSLHFNHILVPGVYVVSVITQNQTFSQKIIIR